MTGTPWPLLGGPPPSPAPLLATGRRPIGYLVRGSLVAGRGPTVFGHRHLMCCTRHGGGDWGGKRQTPPVIGPPSPLPARHFPPRPYQWRRVQALSLLVGASVTPPCPPFPFRVACRMFSPPCTSAPAHLIGSQGLGGEGSLPPPPPRNASLMACRAPAGGDTWGYAAHPRAHPAAGSG